MGLGPGIKMTTLHHFRCPLVETLAKEERVEFAGVILDGVSEGYDQKLQTAQQTAQLALEQRWDGALVAIDGWGNHHVDFTAVIEQLGERGIPAVGLSYLGEQGKLVCTNPYVDLIVDFNKSDLGYESCVVGENTPSDYDARKATGLLLHKMGKWGKAPKAGNGGETCESILEREYCDICQVKFGEKTVLSGTTLTIADSWKAYPGTAEAIDALTVSVLQPGQYDRWVNSNLDFSPIAVKCQGVLGTGRTRILSGVVMMLTGSEATGYQPANIGSSEGILREQVAFDRAGTAAGTDWIIHMDVRLREGQGRTAEGIFRAHEAMDLLAQDIRGVLRQADAGRVICTRDYAGSGKRRVGIVKLVSGLGCMYDTVIFPKEPAGILGGTLMRARGNQPVLLTPNACRDGAVHALV